MLLPRLVFLFRRQLILFEWNSTALNQDISDLETEKESLERKLELRNTAHDELSKQLVQLQKSLAETKA